MLYVREVLGSPPLPTISDILFSVGFVAWSSSFPGAISHASMWGDLCSITELI